MKAAVILLILSLLCAVNGYSKCDSEANPVNSSDLDKNTAQLSGKKMYLEVSSGQVASADMTMADDHLLQGATLILSGGCVGDEIKMQVVPPAPYESLAVTFADWYAKDVDFKSDIFAKVKCGYKIKAIYTNTCTVGTVKVRINLLTYLVTK